MLFVLQWLSDINSLMGFKKKKQEKKTEGSWLGPDDQERFGHHRSRVISSCPFVGLCIKRSLINKVTPRTDWSSSTPTKRWTLNTRGIAATRLGISAHFVWRNKLMKVIVENHSNNNNGSGGADCAVRVCSKSLSELCFWVTRECTSWKRRMLFLLVVL